MEEKTEAVYKIFQGLLGDIIPSKTALIIVDMQKYQVKKDFSLYKAMNKLVPGILDYFTMEVEEKVIPNLQEFIKFCHEVGIVVIYTKYASFRPDGSDLSNTGKTLNNFVENLFGEVAFPYISHPGCEIVDEIKPQDTDFIVQKNTSGTFISTRLDSILKNMEIENVLVSGVVTNFCVHSTAREAVDYGFQTVILEDCCAAWSEEIHSSILKSFGLLYGAVLPYKKLIKKINRAIRKQKIVLIH